MWFRSGGHDNKSKQVKRSELSLLRPLRFARRVLGDLGPATALSAITAAMVLLQGVWGVLRDLGKSGVELGLRLWKSSALTLQFRVFSEVVFIHLG